MFADSLTAQNAGKLAGPIAGGVLGLVAVVAGIIASVVFFMRRCDRRGHDFKLFLIVYVEFFKIQAISLNLRFKQQLHVIRLFYFSYSQDILEIMIEIQIKYKCVHIINLMLQILGYIVLMISVGLSFSLPVQ